MRFIVIALFVLVAGCTRVPSLSQAEARAIETAASSLLSTTHARDVSQSEWVEEFRVLYPEAILIRSEGLYVVTSSWFAEEAGLFVPRQPAAFSPMVGSDPEYRSMHGHVYSYRVRG